MRQRVPDHPGGAVAVGGVPVDERARPVVEVRDHDPDGEGEVGERQAGEDEMPPGPLADGEEDPHDGEDERDLLLARRREHQEGDRTAPTVLLEEEEGEEEEGGRQGHRMELVEHAVTQRRVEEQGAGEKGAGAGVAGHPGAQPVRRPC